MNIEPKVSPFKGLGPRTMGGSFRNRPAAILCTQAGLRVPRQHFPVQPASFMIGARVIAWSFSARQKNCGGR